MINDMESATTSQHVQTRESFPTQTPADQDGPEALIRSDTMAVNYIRCFAAVVLILATIFTSLAAYKLLLQLELDAFSREFDGVATRMAQQFMEDFRLKLWQAFAISFSMTGSNVLTESVSFPAQLGDFAQETVRASRVVYSPVLRTESDRLKWEKYATATADSDSTNNVVESNVCYLCGSQDWEIGLPNRPLHLPSYPSYPCGEIQQYALTGALTTSNCLALTPLVKDQCQCQPVANQSVNQNPPATNKTKVASRVFHLHNGVLAESNGPRPYIPIWQSQPPVPASALLFDQMSDPLRRLAIRAALKYTQPAVSRTAFNAEDYDTILDDQRLAKPTFSVFHPILESINTQVVIGMISLDFSWNAFFKGKLPLGSDGVHVVIENTQGQTFTFQAEDGDFIFRGYGDLHDTAFDHMTQSSTFEAFGLILRGLAPQTSNNTSGASDTCLYRMRAYPSQAFKNRFTKKLPFVCACVVVVIFAFATAVFVTYDFLVKRRQAKVMRSANQYSNIVASLYPANVRSRVLEATQRSETNIERRNSFSNTLYDKEVMIDVIDDNDPIADLFHHTTVFFADIVGFTAWSAGRQPVQVFKLLETIYGAFDRIAKRLGVFKVETVGDCYVAATGLPEPQKDHAVIMATFAIECLATMAELRSSLESVLGPGTEDLYLRMGMHSGPVIGGVLRGNKARFQLFGDTINTASRMESTGHANKIQLSQETADLLVAAGNGNWIVPRDGPVSAKGKGLMQTYWIEGSGNAFLTKCSPSTEMVESNSHGEKNKTTATPIPASRFRRERNVQATRRGARSSPVT